MPMLQTPKQSPRISPKFKLNVPVAVPQSLAAPEGLGTSTTVSIGNQSFFLVADELEVVSELGRGAYGDVHKMREKKTGAELAVKRIRYTMNTVEQRRTAMDMDVAMRSLDCPHTVHFYGAMFRDGDVWIVMEVMDTCLDRLYRRVLAEGGAVSEAALREVALAIVSALNYLHKQLRVIHRDVKPSNILVNGDMDNMAAIKLCDFGISAYLVDSLARTREAGTSSYLAPERILEDGEGMGPASYGVKADVWSLGISLLEVATGTFPYPAWSTPFEQLKLVVEGPPPQIPSTFTPQFAHFLSTCLSKKVSERANYTELLQHNFLQGP